MISVLIACEPSETPYDVVLANCGNSEIFDIKVDGEKYQIIPGGLRPGDYAIHAHIVESVPERATISWKDDQGREFIQPADLKKYLPSDFARDGIVFQIWGKSGRIGFRPIPQGRTYLGSWRAEAARKSFCELTGIVPAQPIVVVPAVQAPVSAGESGSREDK